MSAEVAAAAPAVEVIDLVKTYGAVRALQGISFTIAPGECLGLLGPNGAGKTTTVEILEGLLAPTSGRVRILGAEWGGGDERAIREHLGVCLQQTVFPEKLTVRETLDLFRGLYARGRAPSDVIAEVGLAEKAKARVGTLSGGQKQRLALACALVADPALLFLDEPTTGLDPQNRRQVWDLIRGFKKGGRTVLLTTHYMEEAERLADRVAVVDQGRVIASGSPRELIQTLGGDHVIEIAVATGAAADATPGDFADVPGVRGTHLEAGLILLSVSEPHLAVPAVLQRVSERGWALTRLQTRHASLEDVFVALTGRHLRDE